MKLRMLCALAIAAVVVGAASGCVPGTSPSPSPTPTFATEAEAFAAAEDTYRAYVDALNQVDLSDPETFEAVYAWTTGDANATDRSIFSRLHADDITIGGQSILNSFEELEKVTANGADVAAVACLDVSAVTLIDASGVSTVDPSRPDVQALQIETVQSSRSPTGMLISSIAGYSDANRCD